MFELILSVCILGDPAQCMQRRVPTAQPMGAMACMRWGQSLARQWLREHPDLTLDTWTCANPDRIAADDPAARDFTVAEVAPGVFVHEGAIATPDPQNAGDVANIGFVIGEEAVAVIDTGGSRTVGEALLREIRARTALPIRWVILTHMHPDHVLGAGVFVEAGATVIGHAKLERALAARADTYVANNRRMIGERAWAGTKIVTPDEGVADRAELDLGGRTLVLEAHPTAHTDNDLTVLDAATGTWWVGDLVFHTHTPALDGSILGWISLLEEMKTREVARIVPGHGPASLPWPEGAEPVGAYLLGLASEVRTAIARGETMGEAMRHVGEDMAGDWALFEEFHKRNVSAAFRELEWE